MPDNFFIAVLILGILFLGVACFMWSDFMSALMGGVWLRILPRSIRRPLSCVLGAVTILFSLFLLYVVLRDLFLQQ
jgi:hypothetical protein